MPTYFKNVDDTYSDPAVIATQSRVQRNAYFEMNREEYGEAQTSATGGVNGSPGLVAAIGGGSGYGGGGNPGCPEVDQYVWVKIDGKVGCVKAIDLTKKKKYLVYNPVTTNFNEIVHAEVQKGVSLVEIITFSGIIAIVSASSKIVKNTGDVNGTWIADLDLNDEILTAKRPNIYQDTVISMTDAGIGDVVELSLKPEQLYVCGVNKIHGIVKHNRKRLEDFREFPG